jgi:hypothetical protein
MTFFIANVRDPKGTSGGRVYTASVPFQVGVKPNDEA